MFDLKICVYFVIVFGSYAECEKNVICYYSSWATYRWSWGQFDVSNINTDLCTHVIYAFAGLQSGRMVSLDTWLDLPNNGGRDNYGAFTALKSKNPKLKTILAVGGWNEGSGKYSVMASTAANRKVFIDSAVFLISTHGFDGLDLDWEYPNRRDTVHGRADVVNFSLLVKELREAFDQYGWFLSSAVSSVEAMAALSYDIPEISKHLDMINIMAYDMYGAWDPMTGHNAPLHRGIGDVGNSDNLFTVDMALQYWIRQGAPLEKLALGVPFYGRTFTLSSPSSTSVRDPASGAGINGPYTQTAGFIGFNEFCLKLQSETWNQQYDSLAMVPYAHSGSNWVSYDDVNSITNKVEYAKSLGINNIMIWSIETDDFHGNCGYGDWPLLRAINNALDSTATVAPTSTIPSTTPEPISTTPTTEEPISTTPTTEEPISTTPTTEEPISTTPTTEEPISTTPTTEESISTTPTTEEPISTIPTTQEPISTTPTTQEPISITPTTEEPISTTPTTEEPISTTPTTEEPISTTPTTQEPISTTPTTQEPISTTSTTQAPTTTVCPPTLPTTTQKESSTLPTCKTQGTISNPSDCGSFYICVTTIDGGLEPMRLDCPGSLHYDSILMACNYPELANCTEE